jgi:hypothetical protein
VEKSVEINLSSILPEDTSYGKVYFTRSCSSSGQASLNITVGDVKQTRMAALSFLQQEFHPQ